MHVSVDVWWCVSSWCGGVWEEKAVGWLAGRYGGGRAPAPPNIMPLFKEASSSVSVSDSRPLPSSLGLKPRLSHPA